MKLDKDFLYWSLPVILWLVQHVAGNSSIHPLGRGMNHNETLVRDQA